MPRRGDRGNVSAAPTVDLMRRLRINLGDATVADDIRSNKNTALTAKGFVGKIN